MAFASSSATTTWSMSSLRSALPPSVNTSPIPSIRFSIPLSFPSSSSSSRLRIYHPKPLRYFLGLAPLRPLLTSQEFSAETAGIHKVYSSNSLEEIKASQARTHHTSRGSGKGSLWAGLPPLTERLFPRLRPVLLHWGQALCHCTRSTLEKLKLLAYILRNFDQAVQTKKDLQLVPIILNFIFHALKNSTVKCHSCLSFIKIHWGQLETYITHGPHKIFNRRAVQLPPPPLLLMVSTTIQFLHGSSVRSKLQILKAVTELAEDDVLLTFFKEREVNGDFIAKVSDILWLREVIKYVDAEASTLADATELPEESLPDENEGGFLKLTRTNEWLLGDNSAPMNKKVTTKELPNDTERRKRLNLLQYEAIKRELLLLTVGIGTACSGYCLVALSIQAAVSYATGVLFSCLYLQLLYQHVDNLSREAVPLVFRQKKSKKIGIRSQDLEDLFERLIKGSSMALSSSRLVIPAALYGLWGLSQHFSSDFFDFQLLPAMVGIFAYKAAALVQVYRDNEDLQLIFPENGE